MRGASVGARLQYSCPELKQSTVVLSSQQCRFSDEVDSSVVQSLVQLVQNFSDYSCDGLDF